MRARIGIIVNIWFVAPAIFMMGRYLPLAHWAEKMDMTFEGSTFAAMLPWISVVICLLISAWCAYRWWHLSECLERRVPKTVKQLCNWSWWCISLMYLCSFVAGLGYHELLPNNPFVAIIGIGSILVVGTTATRLMETVINYPEALWTEEERARNKRWNPKRDQ